MRQADNGNRWISDQSDRSLTSSSTSSKFNLDDDDRALVEWSRQSINQEQQLSVPSERQPLTEILTDARHVVFPCSASERSSSSKTSGSSRGKALGSLPPSLPANSLMPSAEQCASASVPWLQAAGQDGIADDLHDMANCTPCKFLFSKNGCEKGLDCKYCHKPHSGKKKRARPSKTARAQCAELKKMVDDSIGDPVLKQQVIKELSATNPYFARLAKYDETSGLAGPGFSEASDARTLPAAEVSEVVENLRSSFLGSATQTDEPARVHLKASI